MARTSRYDTLREKIVDAWRSWTLSRKAFTFAMIGVVNATVDYIVFLMARAALTRSATALAALGSVSDFCHCGDVTALTLIASNLISWSVAVTGSYVLNSSITFAAESGRKLRWRRYFTFAASGVAGWLANTAMLLIAAQILLLPIWLAKAVAMLASFLVNFSLSHFVVFRARAASGSDRREDA